MDKIQTDARKEYFKGLIFFILFGSIAVAVMRISNSIIEGIIFRGASDILIIIIIIASVLIFLSFVFSNKTIPLKQQQKR